MSVTCVQLQRPRPLGAATVAIGGAVEVNVAALATPHTPTRQRVEELHLRGIVAVGRIQNWPRTRRARGQPGLCEGRMHATIDHLGILCGANCRSEFLCRRGRRRSLDVLIRVRGGARGWGGAQ